MAAARITELIALTKECLAAEASDRPKDAQEVADGLSAYLDGVQERVQVAERERAVAEARAIEERRRRRVQLALAASLLALTTLGGLGTTYYLQQRAARAAAGQRVIDQVTTLHKQAIEHPEEIGRWEIALAAVEQADPAGDPKTRAQLVALQKEIEDGPSGQARQDPARSAGRHPQCRGRRPGRVGQRQRLRRRLPRRPGLTWPSLTRRGSGGADQGPPAVGRAGHSPRRSTTGRCSSGAGGETPPKRHD